MGDDGSVPHRSYLRKTEYDLGLPCSLCKTGRLCHVKPHHRLGVVIRGKKGTSMPRWGDRLDALEVSLERQALLQPVITNPTRPSPRLGSDPSLEELEQAPLWLLDQWVADRRLAEEKQQELSRERAWIRQNKINLWFWIMICPSLGAARTNPLVIEGWDVVFMALVAMITTTSLVWGMPGSKKDVLGVFAFLGLVISAITFVYSTLGGMLVRSFLSSVFGVPV